MRGMLEASQREFNGGGKKISMADLIVLTGCASLEEAARKADYAVTVPFTPGRMDASLVQTDVVSMAVPEPIADGFFVNLLDMATEWKPMGGGDDEFEGVDRKAGEHK